jgi:hypothetical protein
MKKYHKNITPTIVAKCPNGEVNSSTISNTYTLHKTVFELMTFGTEMESYHTLWARRFVQTVDVAESATTTNIGEAGIDFAIRTVIKNFDNVPSKTIVILPQKHLRNITQLLGNDNFTPFIDLDDLEKNGYFTLIGSFDGADIYVSRIITDITIVNTEDFDMLITQEDLQKEFPFVNVPFVTVVSECPEPNCISMQILPLPEAETNIHKILVR